MVKKSEELFAKIEEELTRASKDLDDPFPSFDRAMARKAIADSLRELAQLIVYTNKVDFDEGK